MRKGVRVYNELHDRVEKLCPGISSGKEARIVYYALVILYGKRRACKIIDKAYKREMKKL